MAKEKYIEKIWDECSNAGGCFFDTIRIAIIVVCVILLSSCATKTKIEYRDRIVDHYNTVVQHDTLRENTHDSVYVEIKTQGDTVYNTKYIQKTHWRDRIVERHDTCWRDSISTEYKYATKEVVKYPKTYWWFLGITILSIIFAIVKLTRWLKIH